MTTRRGLLMLIPIGLLGAAIGTLLALAQNQPALPAATARTTTPAATPAPTSPSDTATPSSTTPTTQQAAQPTTVLTDQGSGTGRTAAFTVEGTFEIRWSFTSDQLQGQEVGYIGISLESTDVDLVEGGGLVANQPGSGEDIWHGQSGGAFVLNITAANGSWTVEVIDT
jgi:hypothetical protein